MKESPNNPYANLIFRETFNDEQSVRKNGGTPTDVSFKNGVGSFNGSPSNINYGNTRDFKSNFSIRAKVNITNLDVAQTIFAKGSGSLTQIALEVVSSNKLWFFGYEGGVAKGDTAGVDISTGEYDIICTFDGTTWKTYLNGELKRTVSMSASLDNNTSPITIGSRGATDYWTNTMNLVEIYKGALTASEVSNLYNNTWNKELTGMDGQASSGNLVTNGTFDTDSDWTYNSSAVKIENGKLTKFDVSSDYIEQDINAISGKKYKVSFEITNLSGGHPSVRLSNNIVYQIDDNGVQSFDAIADGSSFKIAGNLALFSIDNVNIKELSPKTLIDFNSTNGVLEDKQVGSVVGNELLEDNNFITEPVNWVNYNVGAWSWNETLHKMDNDGVTPTLLSQNVLNSGKKYRLSFNIISIDSNKIVIRYGDNVDVNTNVVIGINTIEFISSTTGALSFKRHGTSPFSITDIYCQEIRDDLSATDVAVKKIGNSYSAEFNGTTSMLDTGTDMIGTKAITVMGWIKPYSFGEGGSGRIINNSKLDLRVYPNLLIFSSDFISFLPSQANSIQLNKLKFIVVTRKSDGKTSFYIGDKSTAPVLNGNVDQDSGTPVAGATNVIIGNNAAQTRTFDGKITKLKVVEGILSLNEITRYWSSTRSDLE